MSSPYPGLDSQSPNEDWAARGMWFSRIKLLQTEVQRTGSGDWVEGEAQGDCQAGGLDRAVLWMAKWVGSREAVGGAERLVFMVWPPHPPSACCSSCLSVPLSVSLAHAHPLSDGFIFSCGPCHHCGPG